MDDLDDRLRAVLSALRRLVRSLTGEPVTAEDLGAGHAGTRAAALARTRHTLEALQPWLFAVFYRHLLDAQQRAARYGRPRCIAALT